MISNCTYLSTTDQPQLLNLLIEYKELFIDGIQGFWDTLKSPGHFDLEEYATPWYGKPYLVLESLGNNN